LDRATLSRHTFLDFSFHLDLFLDTGGDSLVTYEVLTNTIDIPKFEVFSCTRKKDHRKRYLDYEGEISQQRGFLKILWKGEYKNKKRIGSTKIDIILLEELLFILE
jgi:hypothetical protein